MARKKEPTKPLFAVKHDFVASLDAFLQSAVNLVGMVDLCVEHGNLPEPMRARLAESLAACKAALFDHEREED